MSKNYKFKSWDEVLEYEIDMFIEDLTYSDMPENYEELIEIIDSATDDYTEWGTDEEFSVAEDFKYTYEEWREKIDRRCRPIMEEWILSTEQSLLSYSKSCGIIIKKEDERDYKFDEFWEKKKDN